MPLGVQVIWLLVLAVPIACVAWTVTHEEIFREPREYCARKSRAQQSVWVRKFFYLFTCEYCFSHYVSAFFVWLTGFALLVPGWRGYFIAWLSLVWISNQYISVFNRLRLDIKDEKITIESKEVELKSASHPGAPPATPGSR